MKINVLLAVLLIIYALIMILTWYLAYYKKKDYDIRCTKKTKGKVIKYSAVKYNEINIPLVEYEVNGVRYRVIGPKFKGAITKYVSLGAIVGISMSPIMMIFTKNSKGLIATLFLTVSVIYTHRENIKRLLSGTERKLGEKK